MRLSKGVKFPLQEIDEEVRIQDFDAALSRGNHKSAAKYEKFLEDALVKEVKKGWIMLIPVIEAYKVPGIELAPMGVVDQLGISPWGEFISKKRITHDLSFEGEFSGKSINSRVIKEDLEPCMFGYTFLCLVHAIVNMRKNNPKKKIWIRKEDFKSAYRRIHLNMETVVKTATKVKLEGKEFVALSLRLPFGGSPCPPDFCVFSDMITDTIIDLMQCEDWNPKSASSEFVKLVPEPKPLDSNIPFEQAREMSVHLPVEDLKADVFIDNIILVAVDKEDNLDRVIAAPCTVIHAVADKAIGETHIPCLNLLALDKNEAKGAPEEVKICLGWKVNSRTLMVSLPDHKFIAWSKQIEDTISHKSASNKQLESILGRLEQIAMIIKMFGHFLNNVRSLQLKASKKNHNVKITGAAKEDLKLSLKFLKRAEQGVSMNTMVFRKPDHIYISDASEHGLGGFALNDGRAWRYIIPPNLRGRAHINLLEFIVQVVSIWIDNIDNKINKYDCLLAIGDNTTAAGWLKRSNFRDNSEENKESSGEWMLKQQVARKLASLILDSDSVLYTQWFKGEHNVVADSLLRDTYFLSPSSHENFLSKTVPQQLLKNFHIKEVPKEISCFIALMLQQLPIQKQRLKPQKASNLAHSRTGVLSSIVSDYTTHSTWMDLTPSKETLSCQLLHKQSEMAPSLQEIVFNWVKDQSTPPSHMWLRPSGQSVGQTQDWTQTVKCASCSKSNGEPTKIKMGSERSRKLCQ